MAQNPILVLHGFKANRDINWFPWVRTQGAARDISVVFPTLPDSAKPTIAGHMRALDEDREILGESPIIVGHSLGAMTALRYVEHARLRPTRVILVAPVAYGVASIANEKYPQEFYEYRDSPYDEEYLRSAIGEVVLFLSRNDPYIDYAPTLAYYQSLFDDKLTLREYPSAGHFNTPAGYTEFPDLLPYLFSE